ncbi:MAG: transposase [Phycisphaerales bacterium]|nr:MAG: transposase [Phycisphaerales bacterium]
MSGLSVAQGVGFRSTAESQCLAHEATRDAGVLAYWELDEALGLTSAIDSESRDSRVGKNTQHGLAALLRQSTYSKLVGGDATNDAERLCVDPAMLHHCDYAEKTAIWRSRLCCYGYLSDRWLPCRLSLLLPLARPSTLMTTPPATIMARAGKMPTITCGML